MTSLSERQPSEPSLAGARAFLYGRVSSHAQEEHGYSLPEQRELCRSAAAALGCVVVGESFEQGSGQDWELEGFVQLERTVKRGGIDVVIVKNTSRLSRKRAKTVYLEHQLEQHGARLYFVEERFADNAHGKLMRSITADLAEFQWDLIRESTMSGARSKVVSGKPLGHGPRPYGWRRIFKPGTYVTEGFEHEPAEAEVLRRMCRELLRPNSSYAQLCAKFTAEGIPTPGGGESTEHRRRNAHWSPSMMASLLNNRMLWGEYRYGGLQVQRTGGRKRIVSGDPERIVTIQLPPIVPLEEVQRVKAALAERRHKRRGRIPADEDPFLLRGLLRCGACDGWLATRTAHVSRRGYRYYFCLKSAPRMARRLGTDVCPLPQVRAEAIEAEARAALRETLLNEQTLCAAIEATRDQENDARRHAERLAVLEAQIASKRAEHLAATRKLIAAEAHGLDAESYTIVRDELARTIETLRVELAELREYQPRGITQEEEADLLAFAARVRRGFDALTLPELRRICELLRLRAVCREDPDGLPCGRFAFSIEWTGAFALRNSDRNSSYFEMLCEPPLMTTDDFQWYLREPLRVDTEGNVVAPSRPGLGVEPDPEKLARYRIG